MANETLRDVLIKTLRYTEQGIEAVVVEHGDGSYESMPKSVFYEYTHDDPEAKIVYEIRSLEELGYGVTPEDIPLIVDRWLIPDWDEITRYADNS
jgi:hypothetical protein